MTAASARKIEFDDKVVSLKREGGMKGSRPHIISITSGKGGVGKTVSTVNLGLAMRGMGLKVIILDGDLSLANVDVVLGLRPRYNLADVIENVVPLESIILDGPMGLRIIPAASGLREMTRMNYVQRLHLSSHFDTLGENCDVLLVDTGAGISDSVMHLNRAADRVVVVTTPEPHAMTDAYAVIKVLHEEQKRNHINLVVNQVSSQDEGLKIFDRISDVAKRFLGVTVENGGCVPYDPQIKTAITMQKAASDRSQHTISGQAYIKIARELCAGINPGQQGNCAANAFRQLLWGSTNQAWPMGQI